MINTVNSKAASKLPSKLRDSEGRGIEERGGVKKRERERERGGWAGVEGVTFQGEWDP